VSVPPEIMQALMGGGGGAPQGGAPGLPPELMAELGGGAPPEGAEGEGPVPPSVADGKPGGGEDSLVTAIDAIQDAIDAEADQEDIQVMLQCQAKLQSILAKNQKEADSMMGGKASPSGMRKAAGAVAGG